MFCYESILKVLQEAAKQEDVDTIFVVTDSDEAPDNVLTLKNILNSTILSADDINNYEPKTIENLNKDIAFLIFTSGSSGFPKAVSHSYNTLLNHYLIFEDNDIGKDTRTLWYSAPLWITNLIFTCRSIMAQATRIFHNDFDVYETLKVIEKYKVRTIYLQNELFLA